MNRTLAKKYTCPCGKEKNIVWLEPLRFCMGFEPSCYGYSVCTECDIMQTHYSGNLDGAEEFQKFMSMQDFKAANDDFFH